MIKHSGRSDLRIDHPPIQAVSSGYSHDVTVVNICRRGLRFRTDGRHEKGDRLRFELQVHDGDTVFPLSLKAKVVNTYGSIADGRYDYGVKFFRFFSWYEISVIEKLVYAKKRKDLKAAAGNTLFKPPFA